MRRTSDDLFLDALNNVEAEIIRSTRQAIDNMDCSKALELLNALLREENPVALYYAASCGCAGESEDEFEHRHVRQLEASASKGFAPALHRLAICYDTGDMVSVDKKKAALLFAKAAERKHPHAQWIYGNDLLLGLNGIHRDEKLGLKFVRESAEAKFEGAIISMAEIFENGLYGVARDEAQAITWREKLNDADIIGY